MALAPLLAGILVVVLWLRDGSVDPTRFLINNGQAIALYGLSSAGFAIGFGLTAFVATIASRSHMLRKDNGAEQGRILLVIGMLFLLGIAAWGVPLITGASSTTRLLMAWLGLLPLMLLLSLATFLPHEDSAGKLMEQPRRLWTLVFPAAVLAFVAATRAKMVSDWLQQIAILKTPLEAMIEAAGASGLQPQQVDSMKSWFLTGIIGVVACPLLSLALAAINLLGRGVMAVASNDGISPAAAGLWLDGMFSEMGLTPTRYSAKGSPEGVSMLASADDPSNDFFVELPITLDQSTAFHQIVSLAEESATYPSGQQMNSGPSADFILEGPAGSGRTATMLAALIQGALVTGDTAIVLVAQESKRDSLIYRLQRATQYLRVDGFVGIGQITPEAVARWADPDAQDTGDLRYASLKQDSSSAPTNTRAIPPRILVGTLEGLEQAFFSLPYGFRELERIVGEINTVAIDDLDSFRMEDRLHLPYVLAKLRLILAADGLSFRTLLVTRPIADAARQLIAKQLLRSVSTDKHWMQLARVPHPEGTVVATATLPQGENDATAIDLLARCGSACLAQRCNVAIIVPLADQAMLSEIHNRCRRSSGSSHDLDVCVVGGIDALPTLGSPDHTLLGSVASDFLGRNGDAAFVVAWKTGDPAAGIFAVPGESKTTDAAKHALMVLPGKESDSLFAQHFSSAARFLRRLQSIPRAAFTAAGLPAAGMLMTRLAQYRPRPDDANTLVDRVILLDPPDAKTESDAEHPDLWSACSLADFGNGDPPTPHRVAIRGVLPASMGIMTDPTASSVTVFERKSPVANPQRAESSRTIIWRAPDGSEIARDDLAYLHSFYLESEQHSLSPTRMQADPSGPVVVDVRPLSNRKGARQPAMPAFEMADLTMPPGIQLRRLLQSSPLAHRVAVFGIVPQALQDERAEIQNANGAPQAATLRMLGLYDGSANLREWELRTCYEAAKFFVLFDPPEDVQSAKSLHKYLLVNWGSAKPETHEDFPELAAAITAAMRWQAPGLERLVRCMGFKIRRQDASPLVGLVFVEPRSTESSGFALMEPIVYDLEVMHEFFDHAANILERASGGEDAAAFLYKAAGIAMNPRVTKGRLTARLDGIQIAAKLLRSIASEAAHPA